MGCWACAWGRGGGSSFPLGQSGTILIDGFQIEIPGSDEENSAIAYQTLKGLDHEIEFKFLDKNNWPF
jgi:hypothetical protein